VFINTRGYSQDYSWVNDGDCSQNIGFLDTWLENELDEPTLRLYGHQNSYYLLIMRVPSGRYDQFGRSIRSYWVFKSEEDDEGKLRALIAIFLNDREVFFKQLNECIGESSINPEFAINWKRLWNYIGLGFKMRDEGCRKLLTDERKSMVAKNNELNRRMLFSLLKRYKLPMEQGLLLVVGDAMMEQLAQQSNLWRALCVSESSQDWRALEVAPKRKKCFGKVKKWLAGLAMLLWI